MYAPKYLICKCDNDLEHNCIINNYVTLHVKHDKKYYNNNIIPKIILYFVYIMMSTA